MLLSALQITDAGFAPGSAAPQQRSAVVASAHLDDVICLGYRVRDGGSVNLIARLIA